MYSIIAGQGASYNGYDELICVRHMGGLDFACRGEDGRERYTCRRSDCATYAIEERV